MPRVTPIDAVPQYDKPPGPIHNRKCRDVIFLIIFGAYWAGMIILAILAVTNGDSRRLMVPTDSEGNMCGLDLSASGKRNLATKPYLYFFNPLQATAKQICVETCPSATGVTTLSSKVCAYDVSPSSASALATAVQQGTCASILYMSAPALNRCVPSGDFNQAIALGLGAGNAGLAQSAASLVVWGQDMARNLIQDTATTWPWMLGALGACVLACFIWLLVLRFFGGLLTFFTIIAVEGVLAGFAWYTHTMWQTKLMAYHVALGNGVATDALKYDRDTALGLFITCTVLASVFLLMIIALRKRIRIAVKIIKEASRAIGAMPMIILFPLTTFVSILVLVAYYLGIAAYIATTPDVTNVSVLGVNATIAYIKYFQWYHLFGFLWTLAWLTGINQTTLAGAVASWYWTMDKKQASSFAVTKSFARTIRYHLGSIALGSFLIAVTQLIRIVLMYLQRHLAQANNRVAKIIFACLQCCFACLEKFIKFINKNAYIMISITGDSFCTAARTATELLVRNAFRLIAVDFVAGFLVFLSKAAVSVGIAFGLYALLQYTNAQGLTQTQFIGAVCILVWVACWMIVSGFFGVYRMAIDTIFLCFCEDCERNDGSDEKPYYMSPDLAALTSVKPQGAPQIATVPVKTAKMTQVKKS
ncbi:hypothetical protein GGF32_006299 [Allomyces javanicus]|nr:hypothetical protein GGF32_006299 [Allomyces javanicus]